MSCKEAASSSGKMQVCVCVFFINNLLDNVFMWGWVGTVLSQSSGTDEGCSSIEWHLTHIAKNIC